MPNTSVTIFYLIFGFHFFFFLRFGCKQFPFILRTVELLYSKFSGQKKPSNKQYLCLKLLRVFYSTVNETLRVVLFSKNVSCVFQKPITFLIKQDSVLSLLCTRTRIN